MAILSVSNVGQSFGAFDLFRGVTGSIPNDGKVGLVGPNGVGKTTLLRIMARETNPSAGVVHLAKGATMGYLTQESSQAFNGRSHTVYEELLTVFDGLREEEAKLRQLEEAMGNGTLTDEMMTAIQQAASAV